jgi:hypothetical protein
MKKPDYHQLEFEFEEAPREEVVSPEKDVPKWMFDGVQMARRIFGLEDPAWNVDIVCNSKPGGQPTNAGHATTQPFNHNVLLEYNVKLKHNYEGMCTVFHEVFHMAMGQVDYFSTNHANRLPPALRSVALDDNELSRESFVSTVSRGVVRYVYPTLWKEYQEQHYGSKRSSNSI